jgi:hypothetical protein
LNTKYLTHKVNFYRELIFGYRQDTKQEVLFGQKLLFGVNYRFCNKDIWVKKVSSLLFLALSPSISLVKILVFPFPNTAQKTVMPYFYKTFGQNMQRKASIK